MSRAGRSIVLVACLLAGVANMAEAQIRWQDDFRAGLEQARQEHKLLLVHFYTDDCPHCDRLSRGALQSVEVNRAIERDFVPIRVHAIKQARLTSHFQIANWPSDVIVDIDGKIYRQGISPQEGQQYAAMLFAAASAAGRFSGPQQYAMPGPGIDPPSNGALDGADAVGRATDRALDPAERWALQPPFNGPTQSETPVYPPSNTLTESTGMRGLDPNHALEPLADGNSVDAQSDRSATQIPARPIAFGPAMPSPADAPNTNHNQRPETANQDAGANHPINPLAELGPTIPYAADDLTDGRTLPPLALDGHCAVTLLEKETWEPGDSRYGVLHMGSLYLFVSPEAQQKFLEDPHRYAPMLAGIDVVKLIEEQRVIPGQRQFGRFYPDPGERRVYLFADEASANRFGVDPDHYMRLAEAIMQQALKGSSESPAARRTK